jgi:hypothetical protein
MTRILVAWLAVACLAVLSAPAFGQAGRSRGRPNWGPGYQPQLSPYLNLLRGGDPASNYYLGVVPEVNRRQFQREASAELAELEEDRGRLPQEDVPPALTTGYPLPRNFTQGYNNTLWYYPRPQQPRAQPLPGRR